MAWLVLAAVSSACGAYDEDLIKPRGNASRRDAGSQASTRTSAASTLVTDSRRDGQLSDDSGVFLDATPLTVCGDGRVTGVEKCDVAIKPGLPGACPTECPDLEKCVPRILNGTACQTACELRQVLCESGDGCCAGNCTPSNDADCSASCGDGVLQPLETCEPRSEASCPTQADCDDGDPCTTDMLMGTAAACNVTCAHIPITQLAAGDGCCPAGANANTDGDCVPRCGNQVHEAGEDCDGVDGCTASCELMLQANQLQCLESAGDDACARCACINCPDTELACWAGSDADSDAKCDAMLACSRASSCFLDDCYCGAGVAGAACVVAASGPCRAQVEMTAGTADIFTIDRLKNDPSTPLGKAYAADACRVAQCQDTCRATPSM